jgi:glycosyltransferase
MKPTISIITVCYNSIETIKRTIKSVEEQDYLNIEYIIKDGGSVDGTVELIENLDNDNWRIVSDQDNGIYDAMNIGAEMASGDYLYFLNSDDFLYSHTVISDVVNSLSKNLVDCIFGNIYYFKSDPSIVSREWISSTYKRGSFATGWHPPHPAFIISKKAFSTLGGFNLNYDIVSDFDLMLRALEVNNFSSNHLDMFFSVCRQGGASDQGFTGILNNFREIRSVIKNNGIDISFPRFIMGRYLRKVLSSLKNAF